MLGLKTRVDVMKSFLFILSSLLLVEFLSAQEVESWRRDGKPMPNTPSMKAKNGFGAALFLTENAKIFEDWSKPEAPTFTPVDKARRNVPIFTVILFAEPGTDASGTANVTADIVVRKPDGSIYGQQKNTALWRHKYPARSHATQLSEGYLAIRIEPNDPSGTYTVEVRVRDHIKNVELSLNRTFDVAR
jgi:hypothetical protein